jgi:septum formation protein
MNILYLASKSSSRKELLTRAHIPYRIIEQDADESKCDWSLSLQEVVSSIACYKMEHCILPSGQEGLIIFVITADTLGKDATGALSGKSKDMADAIEKLKAANGINYCGTAFCLDRKIYTNGSWQVQERILEYVQARFEWYIREDEMNQYITTSGALDAAGAIKIELGQQFLKKVDGSYSTIVGLPMFELCNALKKIGFY